MEIKDTAGHGIARHHPLGSDRLQMRWSRRRKKENAYFKEKYGKK